MVAPAPSYPRRVSAWTRAARDSRCPRERAWRTCGSSSRVSPSTRRAGRRCRAAPRGPSCRTARSPSRSQSLGLVDRTDTKLWWAVVWKDPRTGGMRASEVRELTVVPRFANRVGSDGALRPSATGRLPERIATAAGGARRPIELAAGYSLVPGGPAPVLPAALKRVDTEATRRRQCARAPTSFSSRTTRRMPLASASRAPGARSSGRCRVAATSSACDAEALARLRRTGGEPWIAAYEPAYKLSPLLDLSAGWARRRDGAAVHGR